MEDISMPRNYEYILEHYRALRERFTSQGDRLWQRFNFFLTVDVALVGGFLAQETLKLSPQLIYLGPYLGIAISLLWFIIGAQDLWFYEDSRERLSNFKFSHILSNIPTWIENEKKKYSTGFPKFLICFKIRKVGVTTFASLIPPLFIVFWILLSTFR